MEAKSKEQIACEKAQCNHLFMGLFAAPDQNQAKINHVVVETCGARMCPCVLDMIVRKLYDENVLSAEEADNLIYGGDEDEQEC